MPAHATPFQRKLLIPLWALRLALVLALIGIYAWAAAYVNGLSEHDVDDSTGEPYTGGQLQATKSAALGVIGALLALLSICAVLDLAAVALFARRRLWPALFALNVLQTLFWLAMLILSAVGTAAARNAGVVVNALVFLLYLVPLVYASAVYRREAKHGRGRYQQAPTSDPHDAATHDFRHQPYSPALASELPDGPAGQSAHSYSDVPQPQAYHDHGSVLPPQQYQAQKQAGQRDGYHTGEGYELPETGRR